jgi:hypothetical protein
MIYLVRHGQTVFNAERRFDGGVIKDRAVLDRNGESERSSHQAFERRDVASRLAKDPAMRLARTLVLIPFLAGCTSAQSSGLPKYVSAKDGGCPFTYDQAFIDAQLAPALNVKAGGLADWLDLPRPGIVPDLKTVRIGLGPKRTYLLDPDTVIAVVDRCRSTVVQVLTCNAWFEQCH